MEQCDLCGFAYEAIPREGVTRAVTLGADSIADQLCIEPALVVRRPSIDRWSALEYAAHVRDVLLTIRDRLVLGLVEDNPGFKPLYRDERIDLGLYRTDSVEAVTDELISAAAMLSRLFDAISPDALLRTVQYGFPDPVPRTLLWMGRQAVHETEHHLADIRQNLSD